MNYFTSKARYQDFMLSHQLSAQNDKLMELDKLKSRFFSNISHELRTPLTLILSPVENILGRAVSLPDSVHEALIIIQKNALRLLKLINEILDIMRLEEKGFILHKKPIDLSRFVPGIVDSVRHLGKAKNLIMHVPGKEKSVVVEADPDRLEKILLNLLINAIKFTPEDGTISVQWMKNNNKAIVEVKDTGIGISAEDLPHIFDRFNQAQDEDRGRSQGVGIGLALAKELVKKHDGKLSASSEPGKGTILRMELPIFEEPLGEKTKDFSVSQTDDNNKDPFSKAFHASDRIFIKTGEQDENLPVIGKGDYTILVVDDEPDMKRFIVSSLIEDYRVMQAGTGEKCLEMIQSQKPDLLLLDWMLPGKNGLEVCQAIRNDNQNADLKIILLTARIDEASKIKALEQGADDFLTKPFSTVEIKTRIANQLSTVTLQKNLRKQNIELENAFNKLKETESQLVQSEKMSSLGVLSAGLMHEVNNPLNYTITALECANKIPACMNDMELKEILKDIEEGMGRIRDIVTDLTIFAYPEKEIQHKKVYLNEALNSALSLVAHETKEISIINKIDDDDVAWCSMTQIIHVFINLLVNASKAVKTASKSTDSMIQVMAKQKKERIEVSVWDNGIGISDKILHRIFEPFFTTRDVGQGIGLGLSMCYTIVENHGGRLQVESKEGEWTQFSFDLPTTGKEYSNYEF